MMLVTRPDYDPATRYLSTWSLALIEEAKRKGLSVMDLADEKARRTDLEGRLQKTNPDLVVLNGHGSDDCVTGQDGEILIKALDNTSLLKGKVTYAVSCNSAAVLGEEVGTYPDTAYIGYEKEFAMFQSRDHLSRPLEDPFAKPFMELSNYVVTSLLKGHGASESIKRAKEVGKTRIYSLLASNADVNAQAVARYLWWDVQCLVCKGEQEKRVI